MADVQVVYLRDVIRITKVEPLDTDGLAGIRVFGNDMRSAATVIINGISAPVIVPVSNTELIVELPSSVVGDLIRSVAVLSDSVVSTDRSVLSFRLGGSSSKVSGILRLVQRVALMLLTSPGSDLEHPGIGGGLLKLVGSVTTGSDSEGSLRATLFQIVEKTARDLKKIQAASNALKRDETLASIALVGVEFDPRTTTLAVRILVESVAGRAAVASLFI